MGTFYRRCDGYRECIRSFVIAGYLRFRSTFFLIATILFIFYTVCVILSKTANIWSPFLDSEVSNKGSEWHPGQAPAEVPVIDSGKPVGNDSVIDHGKAVGNDSVIDLGKPLGNDPKIDLESSSGKDPVVDLGYPLGKNPVINLGYSKYQGNTRKDGVTTWLGIRYAAPPIGDLRFAPPKDPPKHGGIQKADKVRLFLPIALTIPLILYSVARSVGAIESLQQTLASMRTVSSWTYMFRQMYQQAPCCQCCSSFQQVASTLMLGHIQIEAVSLLLRRAAS
jgi:hypothetical protein